MQPTVETGIYHCLITFYKWICGYLYRGKCRGDVRYEKLTFWRRHRLSERPSARQQLAVLTAKRCRGNYRPSRGSSIRISLMDPRVGVDVKAFFFFYQVISFRYLMHKWCNSDCYLSPSPRCLSLLSHTISFLLILTLNWSAKPCCSRQTTHSNGHLHYLKVPCKVQYNL